ncbi:DUF4145 domain-containing protein (plasmid) [Deinococcus sp. KNUC1210]|uniref:DUF4145 domain-containing protein n=1 Tax=Deinococcus sp. KNUC1210 TaxID=2917691 RepID=UPI001EEF873D|nr:DUF4145 domain-containing protein [Deinococcus sp. KNUC1210]ULH17438.1 DUF4145 domain-containing protein [Deinococcus sp. KNUC1210]
MRSIPVSSITQWQSGRDPSSPLKINSTCGVCGRNYALDVSHGTFQSGNTWFALVQCPNIACAVAIRLIGFDVKNGMLTQLFVDPSFADKRPPVDGIENAPERVQKAYSDTIAALNGGIPSAVATLARRTLEGIVKLSYPNPEEIKDKSLFKLIKDLPDAVELDKPIIELSHAMREGGNLGAHFDLDKETNIETAVKMVELLENLIEYLYVIPNRVDALKKDFE